MCVCVDPETGGKTLETDCHRDIELPTNESGPRSPTVCWGVQDTRDRGVPQLAQCKQHEAMRPQSESVRTGWASTLPAWCLSGCTVCMCVHGQ